MHDIRLRDVFEIEFCYFVSEMRASVYLDIFYCSFPFSPVWSEPISLPQGMA